MARLSLEFPQVLEELAAGRVHLSGLHVLAPVLSPGNVSELLGWAAGKTKKLIEAHVDAMRRESGAKPPKLRPTVRPVVFHRAAESPTVPEAGLFDADSVPDSAPAPAPAPAPASKPDTKPAAVSEGDISKKVVMSVLSLPVAEEVLAKWEKASALMARRGGDGAVLEAALDLLIAKLETERFGAATNGKAEKSQETKPAKTTRHIPNHIRRAVYERDGGRCTFVDSEGRRCDYLNVELHHIHAFGLGGAHSVDNLTLYCPQHNTLAAEQDYGKATME